MRSDQVLPLCNSEHSVIRSDQVSFAKTHFRDHIPVAFWIEVRLNQIQCLVLLTINMRNKSLHF